MQACEMQILRNNILVKYIKEINMIRNKEIRMRVGKELLRDMTKE